VCDDVVRTGLKQLHTLISRKGRKHHQVEVWVFQSSACTSVASSIPVIMDICAYAYRYTHTYTLKLVKRLPFPASGFCLCKEGLGIANVTSFTQPLLTFPVYAFGRS